MLRELPEAYELELRMTAQEADIQWWLNDNYITVGFIEVDSTNPETLALGGKHFIKCERFDDVYFFRNQLTVAMVRKEIVESLISNVDPVKTISVVDQEYKVV